MRHFTGHISAPCQQLPLVATIHQAKLIIRDSTTYIILRSIPLDQDFAARCRHISWFNHPGDISSRSGPAKTSRLLLADNDTVLVYDAQDPAWKATVTGASGHTGRIRHVEFGHTPQEIIVYSDFGVKATIWNLDSGDGAEIQDIKFGNSRSHSFQPSAGTIAFLTRREAKDSIVLLDRASKCSLGTFALGTIDAQIIGWSPDSRWLAVAENSCLGYQVFIYSAIGQLFKTYSGGETLNSPGAGIKKLTWDPAGRYLAISGNDGRVVLLNTRSFTPTSTFIHTSTIITASASTFQEEISLDGRRTYTSAAIPALPPSSESPPSKSSAVCPQAVTHLSFNSTGTLVATVCAMTPTTVWIWSLSHFKLFSVLIHHSAIKTFQWHPWKAEFLLIQTVAAAPVLHLWDGNWEMPKVLALPTEHTSARASISFMASSTESSSSIGVFLSNSRGYTSCQIPADGDLEVDDIPAGQGEDTTRGVVVSDFKSSVGSVGTMFDDGASMDFSPIKIPMELWTQQLDFGDDGGAVDDTFGFRRVIS